MATVSIDISNESSHQDEKSAPAFCFGVLGKLCISLNVELCLETSSKIYAEIVFRTTTRISMDLLHVMKNCLYDIIANMTQPLPYLLQLPSNSS
jgi:hypothetical protein